MKKLILLATAALFLVGCNEEFRGKMTLAESLTLTNKSKDPVTFAPGEYRTKLEPKSKSKIQLQVHKGEKKVKMIFKLPKDFEIPDLKGNFKLMSKDSKQPVDLYGAIDTTYSETDEKSAIESCSYDVYERRCTWYKDPKTGKKYKRCRCERNTYNDGDQRVRYYLRYTDKHMEVAIAHAGDTEAIGEFKGFDRTTRKIYTYQGYCQPRRYDRCR